MARSEWLKGDPKVGHVRVYQWASDLAFPSHCTFNDGAAFLLQMVRAQFKNGESIGTKDVEAQIKFLQRDIDFSSSTLNLLGSPPAPPLSSIQNPPKPKPRDPQRSVLINPNA